MKAYDERVDVYIEKAAQFAQPILRHIRVLVHQCCPEVLETIKWNFPHFIYHGDTLCSMAAFKQHCAFGFWKSKLMEDPANILGSDKEEAMGNFGRIHALKDFPSRTVLRPYFNQAMQLNRDGIKVPRELRTRDKGELEIPLYLRTALASNAAARASFEAFPPSHKREYVEWLVSAKTDATRDRRLTKALEWMSEGKPQNWRYMKEYRHSEK